MAEIKKELQVVALENGTVIDHIPSEQLFKVVSLLHLHTSTSRITIGNNLDSERIGKKGIIKISDKFFEEYEINRISLIAPNVRLNIIQNYEVIEKKQVTLPDLLVNTVKCANPNCISNNEPMETRFHVTDKKNVAVKCHYCERVVEKEDIEIL
ncbi:MAG: aspartate carbamoyltransferase regulatory subunit [Candidatus Azobacteroides sp.]|jgi:aspartate carbamoyltransferase regulatory subunit|nr:aspartate carbamoyltransferase regulatory subunit [Candidatus Azobacteroides sp.]